MESHGWEFIIQDRGASETLKLVNVEIKDLTRNVRALEKSFSQLDRANIKNVKHFKTLTRQANTAAKAVKKAAGATKGVGQSASGIRLVTGAWTELNSKLQIADRVVQGLKVALIDLPKGLAKTAASTASLDTETAELSKSTGISLKVMAGLERGAKQHRVSVDSLQDAYRDFAERMRANPENFAKLNISLKGARGGLASTQTAFLRMADAVKNAGSESQRLSILAETIGDEAMKLEPLFRQGAAGIEKMADEADRLGLVLDQQTIANMRVANKEIADFEGSLDLMVRTLGRQAAPAFAGIAKVLREELIDKGLVWIKNNGQTIQNVIITWAEGMVELARGGLAAAKSLNELVQLPRKINIISKGFDFMGRRVKEGAAEFVGLNKGMQKHAAETEKLRKDIRSEIDILKGRRSAFADLEGTLANLGGKFKVLRGQIKETSDEIDKPDSVFSPDQLKARAKLFSALGVAIERAGESAARMARQTAGKAASIGIGVKATPVGKVPFGDEEQTIKVRVASSRGAAKAAALEELEMFKDRLRAEKQLAAAAAREKYGEQVRAAANAELRIQSILIQSGQAKTLSERKRLAESLEIERKKVQAAKEGIEAIRQAEAAARTATSQANAAELQLVQFQTSERIRLQKLAFEETKRVQDAQRESLEQMASTVQSTVRSGIEIFRVFRDEQATDGQKVAAVLQNIGDVGAQVTQMLIQQSGLRIAQMGIEMTTKKTAAVGEVVANAAVGASAAGAQTAGQTGIGAIAAVPAVIAAVFGIISALAATLHTGGVFENGRKKSLGTSEATLRVRKNETAIIMQPNQMARSNIGGGDTYNHTTQVTMTGSNFQTRSQTMTSLRDNIRPALRQLDGENKRRRSRRT